MVKYIFSLILLGLIIIHFVVLKSYIYQVDLIQDFNSGTYRLNNIEKLNSSNISFPNITITALPMQTMLANYYYHAEQYNEALGVLNKSVNDNPYLYSKESLKSKIFLKLGVIDSALYYSDLAYNNIPKNINHFNDYLTSLTVKGSPQDLYDAFLDTPYDEDIRYWEIYLSALFAIDNVLPDFIIGHIKINFNDFENNLEIRNLAENIVFGEGNILKSQELIKSAEILYGNSNFLEASELFIESYNLNPRQYSSYENAAICFVELKDFTNAFKELDKIFKNFTFISPKTNYLMGLVLINNQRIAEACPYLLDAKKNNFKPAFSLFIKNCN